jgi:stalled ribosome rescue protein Dom34
MTEHFHFLVWIDHQIAKIINFNSQESNICFVRSGRGAQHLHHKANAGDSGHVGIDTDFLKQVTHALQAAGAIMVTGPASAKNELVTYIHREHPELAKRLSGVAALDHPTDGELLAFGRKFFRADDRMHPQRIGPVT